MKRGYPDMLTKCHRVGLLWTVALALGAFLNAEAAIPITISLVTGSRSGQTPAFTPLSKQPSASLTRVSGCVRVSQGGCLELELELANYTSQGTGPSSLAALTQLTLPYGPPC
ncbi:hypothetical protein QJQ45_003978 [Haematococcus lacustris]|nr:hypothetical protein QJQ45_003978 [Haematococcus lacustris]